METDLPYRLIKPLQLTHGALQLLLLVLMRVHPYNVLRTVIRYHVPALQHHRRVETRAHLLRNRAHNKIVVLMLRRQLDVEQLQISRGRVLWLQPQLLYKLRVEVE